MGEWSWEQRNERARALGFEGTDKISPAGQMRKANAGALNAAREAIGDAAGIKRSDAAREQSAQRAVERAEGVVQLRNGEVTSSRYAKPIRDAVKRARTADRRLSAVVTVEIEPSLRNPAGGLRDVRLWPGAGESKDGRDHRYNAEGLFNDIADYGGVKPAFLYHVAAAMARAKYPETPTSVEHIDLTATD